MVKLQINMGLHETEALHLSHHLRTQDNHLHHQEQDGRAGPDVQTFPSAWMMLPPLTVPFWN